MTQTAPFAWPPVLAKLMARQDLDASEAESAMAAILEGSASSAQIAGFVIALRAKGETAAEIAALARTMLAFAERVEVSGAGPLLDTCGTGGDRSGSINVSTVAAFVAAGAGARVAKHGNRSASSECGSADLLEQLGVTLDPGPAGVARCIEEAGIGFCFAPRYHPALRHAGPTRRELGVPTTFNFLGPLANPAGARRQALGVSDPAMAERVVAALDELTTTTTSAVWELRAGEVRTFVLDPKLLGVPQASPGDLRGGGPARNAEVATDVLSGAKGPARDIVVLNAAAALVVAGVAAGFAEGLEAADASLTEGRAAGTLEQLVALSGAPGDAGGSPGA